MTTDNQISIIENSIEIFKGAPEVLKKNQERSIKAIAVGQNILSAWENAFIISNEDEKLKALSDLDLRSNNFLVNCATAVKEQKELRAAITQMMDAFKGMFTSAENEIDKAKEGTIPSLIQKNRNNFAKINFEYQEKKRKALQKIEDKKKEASEIKSKIEIDLMAYYNAYLSEQKTKVQKAFNSITLDDIEIRSTYLKQFDPIYNQSHFDSFEQKLPFVLYHGNEEIAFLKGEALEGNFLELERNYKAELSLLRDDLIDKLGSKLAELNEAKRLADEAKRLADEAARATDIKEKARLADEAARAENEKLEAEKAKELREAADTERIAQETKDSNEQATASVAIKAQGEATMAMFETHAAIAEDAPTSIPKLGYEIEIKHPVAFTQIFAHWFEKVGKNLPIDKIGNTKLDQMKAWAEKDAFTNNVKIDSKFLTYVDSFKAVNKK